MTQLFSTAVIANFFERSTAFIANQLERSRWLLVALIVVISLIAGWGYVPKAPEQDETTNTTTESAARESGERGDLDGDLDGNLDGDSGECLLVIDVDDLFTPDTASAIRDVVSDIRRLDYVRSVFWLDDVPTVNLFGLANPILPPNHASLGRFQLARKRAVDHPLVRGQLLSPDGKTILISVGFDWAFVESDEACTTGLVGTVERVLEEKYPDLEVKVQLTGRVPIYLAAKQAYDRNDTKFQVIGYSMALILAILIFRHWSAVLIVSLPPALGIFWSLGMVQLLEQQYNPLTQSVLPVLISMVGLTDGVHLMIHIRRLRGEGASPMEAAKSAINKVGLACALTSLTTAIGFGSLMLAHHEWVRGFGLACAIGVVLTFISVVTVIPLLTTSWLGRNVHKGQDRDIIGRNIGIVAPLIDWVIQRARVVGTIGILLTLGLGLVTLSLRPDDRTGDSQPTGSPAYAALLHCDEAFGGIDPIELIVHWPEDVPPDSPAILKAVEDVERVVNDEPLVQNPISIRNFVDSFGGEPDIESRMSYLALMPEQLKRAYFKPRQRTASIQARIQDVGIAKYVPVFDRIDARLGQLRTKYPGFDFQIEGRAVDRGRDLYQIVVDLAASLGTATIIILIVMSIVYQSLRIGLITLVPNLFPLVTTGTGLVLSGQALDISGVCAFTICLGIAVDDTIHFLTRYQFELQVDHDPRGAIKRSFFGVGSALIMTTLILVTCFSTVLTSELRGHRTFAGMACSTIGAALIGDLLFLPALLLMFPGRKRHTQFETLPAAEHQPAQT